MKKDTKSVLSKSALATLSLGLLFVPTIAEAVDNNEIHFVSINNTASSGDNVGNYNNDGAKKDAAIAIGREAAAYDEVAIALGLGAQSRGGNGAVAIGRQARTAAMMGLAIGSGAAATHDRSVAIGALSMTDVAHVGDFAFVGAAGAQPEVAGKPTASTPVFSIGSSRMRVQRQIQNVAAGVVSESSTDAVNGSQLYHTAKWLTSYADAAAWNISGAPDSAHKVANGNTVRFVGAGNTSVDVSEADSSGVTTVTISSAGSGGPVTGGDSHPKIVLTKKPTEDEAMMGLIDSVTKANNGKYYVSSEVGPDGNPIGSATELTEDQIVYHLTGLDGKVVSDQSVEHRQILSGIANGVLDYDAVNKLQLDGVSRRFNPLVEYSHSVGLENSSYDVYKPKSIAFVGNKNAPLGKKTVKENGWSSTVEVGAYTREAHLVRTLGDDGTVSNGQPGVSDTGVVSIIGNDGKPVTEGDYSTTNTYTVTDKDHMYVMTSDKPTYKTLTLQDGSSKPSTLTADPNGNLLVNGKPLTASSAGSSVEYFSVNSTEAGNKDNRGATAVNAIAIGPDAASSSDSSIVLGNKSSIADSTNSGVFGNNNVIAAFMGADGTKYNGAGNVYAFGDGNEMKNNSNTTAIGVKNRIHHSQGTSVLGNENRIVNDANRQGSNSTQLIGNKNAAQNVNTATIIGNENITSSNYSNIIGNKNTSTSGQDATVLGNVNTVSGGANSAIIGNENTSSSNYGSILGSKNVSTKSAQVTVVGNENTVSSVSNAAVVGNKIVIDRPNTFVLGSNITANLSNSVYLGDSSTMSYAANASTGGSTGTVSNAQIGNVTIEGFAGATAKGGVTVGSAGAERRIANVAAGRVSPTATDAVNGSQLYAVAVASRAEVVSSDKSVTVTKTTEADKHDKFDLAVKKSALTLNPDGKTVTPSEKGNAFTTGDDVAAAVNKAAASARTEVIGGVNTTVTKTVDGSDGHDKYAVNVQGDLTRITSIANDNTKITLNPTDVNFGDKKLTGVAPAELSDTSTEAVNGSQLKATNDRVKKVEGDIYNVDESGVPTTLKGLKFVGNKETADHLKTLGETVSILGDSANVDKAADFSSKNVLTENKADGVHIMISDKPEFKEMSITGGPKMTASGIDMGNKKITNLAPGTADTDGVNKSQLDAAINAVNSTVNANKIKYFSVKSAKDVENAGNDGAKADGSIAIGPKASAAKSMSVAMGYNASAADLYGIAIGESSRSVGDLTVAIGSEAETKDVGGIAVGYGAVADKMSTAVGAQAKADGAQFAQVFGTAATLLKLKPGENTVVAGKKITISDAASAGGVTGNVALVEEDEAALREKYGDLYLSMAMGTKASAHDFGAVAIGGFSTATHKDAVALGNSAQALARYTSALGDNAKVSAENSVALGSSSQVKKEDAKDGKAVFSDENVRAVTGVVSVGSEGVTRRIMNVAGGIDGNDAVNVKQLKAARTQVTGTGAVVVTDSVAEDGHKVYNVHVDKTVQFTKKDGTPVVKGDDGKFYEAKADGTPDKAKEVANGDVVLSTVNPDGTSTKPTKLTNVADGDISDTSKDAVNGSQLKATNDRVKKVEGDIYNVDESGVPTTLKGLKFVGNKETADHIKTLGETVSILGDAANADKAADFSSKNVLTENKADGVHIMISDKPEFRELAITGGPTLTASGIDMGNKKITNLAPGMADKDGVNKKQLDDAVTNINSTINANKIHYFSVKQNPNVGNYNNDGAEKDGAVAIGPDARATLEKGTALGYNARSFTKEGLAIGVGSGVWNEGGNATGGIAIGRGAGSHLMSTAAHESVIAFNHKDDRTQMVGGIAIGDKTHARIGTIDMGHRDYVGKIGDIEFGNSPMTSNNVIDGVGSTTVGTNSVNSGNFASINGAYNVISNRPTKVGHGLVEKIFAKLSNVERATQGLGATITGTFNSIENNFENGFAYSGMASSVVGIGNRINKSNATLVMGAGNEVTNSYLNYAIASMSGSDNIKEMADAIRDAADKGRMGSVAVIGGANKVDYAVLSNVQGVGNTLKGTEGSSLSNTLRKGQAKKFSGLSAYNSVNGYENTATNVNFTSVAGAQNSVENGEHVTVSGSKNALTGVNSSAVLGDGNTFSDVRNVFVLGNEVKGNVGNSVYLGSGSSVVSVSGKNLAKDGTEGATTTGGATGTVNKAIVGEGAAAVTYEGFAGSVAKGAVSVGSAGDERRVMNVAAGEISKTSTDAVNGSQLYVVAEGLNKRVDKVEGDITSLKTDVTAARTEVKSKDGSVTVAKTAAADGHDVYDLAVRKSRLTVSPDGKTVNAEEPGNAFATAGDVAAAVNKVAASARTEVKDGVNTKVEKETAKDGHDIYKVNVKGDLEEITSISNGDIKLTLGKDNIDAGGAKLSNLAAGVKDTDGVNVKQLKDALTATGAASRTEVKAGSDNVEVVKTNDPKDLHDIYKIKVDEKHNDDLYSGPKGDRKLKGLAFEGNVKSGTYTKTLGDSVKILGNTGTVDASEFSSKNLLTETTKDGLFIKMNDNPEFKAVKADSLTVNGGPVIDGKGIDMSGKEIVHAKPGTRPDSVATVSQLDALAGKVSNANANLGREIGQVGAMGAAFSALMPLDYDEEYPTQINVGFGYYHGLQAGALGLTHYVNRDFLLNAAVALSGDNRSVRFGASMRIGSSPKYQTLKVSTTEYAALKKVESLTETVTKLQQVLEEQRREIDALKQQQH